MFFRTEDLRGTIPLNILPRLKLNESVNDIDFIPIRTSRRLGCNIIALEDAYKYMTSYSTNLTVFIESVSYIHDIPYENLAFSVKPSSVYFNPMIQEMYLNLQEQNVPIYIQVDYNSNESRLIDRICEQCIQTNSTKLLDVLQEGIFDSILGGATEGAGEAGGNFLSNLFNGVVSNMGQSVRQNLQQSFDKNTFGRMGLDTKEIHDVIEDGKLKKKEVNVAFGGLKNKIMNNSLVKKFAGSHPNMAGTIADGIVGAAKDAREIIGQQAMGFLQDKLGIDPTKPITVDGLLNALNGGINKLRGRPGSGGNQGIIQSIINQLIKIKNQLLGHRR